MSNIKEVAQELFCECCAYTTDRKDNFTRHLVSKKHQKKMNGEETSSVEEEKPKTRKPRTPKIKKNTEESSIQTDSDDETVYSNFIIEYESNDDKIKELKEMYEKQINELKEENELLKNSNELLQQEKEELQREIDYLTEDNSVSSSESTCENIENELKIKDDTIYDLKCQIQDLQEFIDDNIKKIKPTEPAIKMIIEEQPTLKCINDDENNYLTKENFESLNKENLLLTDEVIKLEEELNSLKCEISNLNIKKYTCDKVIDDEKKKSKKMKNDNLKNPMEIYKELCRDSKFNNKIMSNSFIDKSNKCEIVKINIIK